jgi:hypothetical protein
MISRKAGSKKAVKEISLDAPIPSKLLPVSIAAITVAALDRASRLIKRKKSPLKLTRDSFEPKGTSIAAQKTDTIASTGAIRKTIPELML